jgi:single-strand DNA-binding protein
VSRQRSWGAWAGFKLLSFFSFSFTKQFFFSSLKRKAMLIIGRITKDAVVKQLKDEKQVVEFSVAVNDYYKPKNGEAKQFTLYVNCAYWFGTKISERLKKGALVEMEGRAYLNAYNDMQDEPKASLNLHVNTIKIHGTAKQTEPAATAEPAGVTEDLPF